MRLVLEGVREGVDADLSAAAAATSGAPMSVGAQAPQPAAAARDPAEELARLQQVDPFLPYVAAALTLCFPISQH